ncbi:hypothetical protein [Streptomyces cellulosae]|uniref:hypothetical protein n=1 Tax=Streptomyces cellulosae TaxID=1968 RepID=UPI0004C4F790|nr:hypothetical protein [Streptomyces cellulosae]
MPEPTDPKLSWRLPDHVVAELQVAQTRVYARHADFAQARADLSQREAELSEAMADLNTAIHSLLTCEPDVG